MVSLETFSKQTELNTSHHLFYNVCKQSGLTFITEVLLLLLYTVCVCYDYLCLCVHICACTFDTVCVCTLRGRLLTQRMKTSSRGSERQLKGYV